MNGLQIKVKTVDGSVNETFNLTPRMLVEFEQKFGKGFGKLIEEEKVEHTYFLAFLALRVNGKGPKPFSLDFIETLESASVEVDPNFESTAIL